MSAKQPSEPEPPAGEATRRAKIILRDAKAHREELKNIENNPALRRAYEAGVHLAAQLLSRESEGPPQRRDEEYTAAETRDAAELMVATGVMSRNEAEEGVRRLLADLDATVESGTGRGVGARRRPKG